MFRISFSDSLGALFPRASKAVLLCDKDRAYEIYGIIESLMEQTGLNTESKLSLGLLHRGLSMGLYQVSLSDSRTKPDTHEADPVQKNEEKKEQEKAEEQPTNFNQTPNLFGTNF